MKRLLWMAVCLSLSAIMLLGLSFANAVSIMQTQVVTIQEENSPEASSISSDTISWVWNEISSCQSNSFYFSGTQGKEFKIDWGDGQDTIVVVDNPNSMPHRSHVYAEPGLYEVQLFGLSADVRITWFSSNYSRVKSLDVRRCTALRNLTCIGPDRFDYPWADEHCVDSVDSYLMSLDVSQNADLRELQCSNNRLTTLDVSRNTVLGSLYCENNYLTTLDVTQNTSLSQLGCSNNRLSFLDLSRNENLYYLHVHDNMLSSLDMGNKENLKMLDCYNNRLSHLNISACPTLENLNCENNRLEALDVTNNPALKNLRCDYNALMSIDVSNNLFLETLRCENNRLTSLDVTANQALEYLYCGDNCLKEVDVSQNSSLKSLLVDNNRLTSLDLQGCIALEILYCFKNQLTSLDLSHNLNLNYLAGENNLREVTVDSDNGFDMSTLPGMEIERLGSIMGGRLNGMRMIFENDRVTYNYGTHAVGVSDEKYDSLSFTLMITPPDTGICDTIFMTWTAAAGVEKPLSIGVEAPESWNGDGRTFWVNFGDGTEGHSYALSDTSFTKTYAEAGRYNVTITATAPTIRITSFNCSGEWPLNNGVTSLNVRGCTALTQLRCERNQLTKLDVLENAALKYLFCGNNQLTELDIRQNKVLVGLSCFSNRLKSLDVSQHTALEFLRCDANQLDTLDLKENSALRELWCDNNRLTNLDVTRNLALNWLITNSNHLVSIDLSQNTNLGTFHCEANSRTVDLATDNGFDLSTLPGMDVSRIGGVIGGRLEGSRLIFEADKVTYQYATHFPGEASLDFDSVEFTLTASRYDTIVMTWTAEAGEEKCFAFAGNTGTVYPFVVDWGDGDTSVVWDVKDRDSNMITGPVTWTHHTYDAGGTYTVLLYGQVPEAVLGTLNCGGTALTSLDITQQSSLWYLDCSGNRLSSLDVTQHTYLGVLYCHDNQLTSLDVSQNVHLSSLACYGNSLSSLDVTQNPQLENLYCNGNQLTSLDVSQNPRLWLLYCYDNQLTSLDVSQNTDLRSLYCYENQLTSLDVSQNTELVYLNFYGNQITEIDLSHNPALSSLGCSSNRLSSLDVRANPNIGWMNCSDNQLSSLDVTQNAALYHLSCAMNHLTELDVTRNAVLKNLYCFANQLTSLDVSGCKKLEYLDCESNRLTSLDVNANTALETLFCSGNKLTSLDVSQNTALTALGCVFNQLSSLDLSQNVALDWLQCQRNLLTSLDVSQNAVLRVLFCFDNPLSTLDVSQNGKLRSLNCRNTGLHYLDVSQNSILERLSCGQNPLAGLDVAHNHAFTELYCDSASLSMRTIKSILGGWTQDSVVGEWLFSGQQLSDTVTTGDTLDYSLDLAPMGLLSVTEIRVEAATEAPVAYKIEDQRLVFYQPGEYQVVLINDAIRNRSKFHWGLTFWEELEVMDTSAVTVIYNITVTGDPIDPTLPDTLVPEAGVGLVWMASAGEEKEMTFKGTGKGFRVDWGDGSVSEAKGGVAPDVALTGGADGAASKGGSDGAATASAPAPKDSEKELKHRYAKEGIYTVQLIPLSQNGRLTDLDVSDERVLSLAFGDASMLEILDCSDNLLTELALPAAAKLKDLDCSENLLAALDLSGCAALQEVDFSDNRLTSLALPTHASLKDVEGEDNRLRLSDLYGLLSQRVKNASYEFDPQADSVRVAENAVFDLASEMTIGGRATTYTLLDAATRRPVPASDYAAEGGLFRFSKSGARYVLTLKNANVTDYEKGRADEVVTFTWYISVSGVGNEDLASDEAATAPWAYVQGRTIYLTSDDLGEVEAFTAVGRRVYRGHDRAFTVPAAGVYVLRAADGRRCKVLVR